MSGTSESLVMEWLEIAIGSNCPGGPRYEGPFTDKQQGVARKAETLGEENMLSYLVLTLYHLWDTIVTHISKCCKNLITMHLDILGILCGRVSI